MIVDFYSIYKLVHLITIRLYNEQINQSGLYAVFYISREGFYRVMYVKLKSTEKMLKVASIGDLLFECFVKPTFVFTISFLSLDIRLIAQIT